VALLRSFQLLQQLEVARDDDDFTGRCFLHFADQCCWVPNKICVRQQRLPRRLPFNRDTTHGNEVSLSVSCLLKALIVFFLFFPARFVVWHDDQAAPDLPIAHLGRTLT
jgi:hypothetical protein